jgi:hypothetical protein
LLRRLNRGNGLSAHAFVLREVFLKRLKRLRQSLERIGINAAVSGGCDGPLSAQRFLEFFQLFVNGAFSVVDLFRPLESNDASK